MDVARTLFAFAALWIAGPAFAAPPSAYGTPQRAGSYDNQNDWSNVGPTTAPTITASPNDRYGFPQSNYPQPPSITARAQNAVTATATSLRDGFDAGVRSAKDTGQSINQQFTDWATGAARQAQPTGTSARPAAQAYGTTSSPSRVSSPFAPQPAAPTTSLQNGKVAPPPNWPTAPAAAPTASPQNWTGSPATSSNVTTSAPSSNATTPISGGWSSMGSSVAPPPLMTPQLSPPTSDSGSTAPPLSTAGRYGPTFPSDQSSRQSSIHSPLVNSTQPSSTNNPSAADTWSFSTTSTSAAPQATIGRNGVGPPPSGSSTARDINSNASQPVATAPQDAKKQTAKSDDWWADENWNRPQQPATGTPNNQPGPAATISSTGSKPPVSAPSNVPAGNNPTVPGATSTSLPVIGSTAVTVAKPNQSSSAPLGEAKPWMTLIAVAVSLAGSLAANLFLGWSYLDARQKYQSLVRRTADTFRRTKVAAA